MKRLRNFETRRVPRIYIMDKFPVLISLEKLIDARNNIIYEIRISGLGYGCGSEGNIKSIKEFETNLAQFERHMTINYQRSLGSARYLG